MYMYSGAFSVGDHLVTNGGDNEGLFRAGTSLRLFSIETLKSANFQSQQSWNPAMLSDLHTTAPHGTNQCTTELSNEQGKSTST